MSDNIARPASKKRRTNKNECMNEHCSGAEVGARIEAAAPILASSKFARSTIALGGARRDRTDDLLLAKQALSQLSYGPGWNASCLKRGGPGKTRTSALTLIKRAL